MEDYIIVLLILVAFCVVWMGALLLSFNRHSHISKEQLEKDAILKRAMGRLQAWLISTTFWMVVEYLLVIVPFVSNVVVIYLATENTVNSQAILIYSAISLSFIVFGYTINPQRHKKCYRKAYSVLDTAINNYLLTFAQNPSTEELVGAISAGEKYIDTSYDVE